MEEKIGVIHYNFGELSLEEFLSWCKENSCRYVELQRKDIEENGIDKVERLINKYGIKISQISAGNDFIRSTEEELKNQVKLIEEMCRIVKNLGGNQLRIDGGWPKEEIPEEKYKILVLEGIKRAIEIAEKEDVYLALDNHGRVTNDYIFQLEIFENIGSDKLGANLDTMNYRWYGYSVEKLPEIYKAIAPYTLHTHLKDGTGTGKDYKGKILGDGEIPLKEAIKILKEAGYKGVWCIEYEGEEKEEGYKRCVEWLKKNLPAI